MVDSYEEDNRISEDGAVSRFGGFLNSAGKFTGWLGSFLPGYGYISGSMVAGGDALKAVEEAGDGHTAKAAKLLVRGAAEAGVVFGSFGLVGLADILVKPITGETVASHVGDVAAKLVDGIDSSSKMNASTAAVGTNPLYAQQQAVPADPAVMGQYTRSAVAQGYGPGGQSPEAIRAQLAARAAQQNGMA